MKKEVVETLKTEKSVSVAALTNTTYKEKVVEQVAIDYEQASQILEDLQKTKVIDNKGKIKDTMKAQLAAGTLDLGERWSKAVQRAVVQAMNKADNKPIIRDASKEVTVKLKKQAILSPEFQEIWNRIKQKTTYRVQFDLEKLIENSIKEIKEMPAIGAARLVSQSASVNIQKSGVSHTQQGMIAEDLNRNYDVLPDIRILELINKRTLQFDGIFGMSDDIVGNFNNSLNDILERRRTIDNILADFSTHLAENWQKNEEIVTNAESVLFTTFTKDIAEKVTISPKYIEEQAELLNADLWEAVKFYFQEYFPQYVIDEDAKTISLPDEYPLPHLFYYNSGSRNVPYTGKRIYGMDKDFKPAANKMTLISPLLKGIFSNIECYEEGKIKLAEEVESCEITFYIATLYAGKRILRYFNVLSGKTESGRLLNEEECRKILNLPIKNYEESGRKSPYMFKYADKESELEASVENELKLAYLKEMNQTFEEDIDIVKIRANQEKARLEKKLEGLREQVKSIKENLSKATDRLAELKIKRELNALEKELKQKEEGLFLEQMQIEVDTENQINSMQGLDGIIIKTGRLFKVHVQ